MASIINATTAGLQETGDPNSQGVLDLQANGVSVVTLSSTTGARFTGNLFDNGIEVGVYAQAAFNAANNSATTASVQSAYTAANNAATTASNAYTAANNAYTTANSNYISAATRLDVTSSGVNAYLIDQYSGNNPAVNVTAGETIAFYLNNLTGHPFMIRLVDQGANYDTGLIHVATNGTVSTGSSAQGKVSGTLYWKVPAVLAGNTYVYQCSNHPGMVGNINIYSYFSSSGGTVTGNVSFANNVTVTQNLTIKSITETLNAIGTVTSASTLTLTDGTVQTATLTASTACTFTMPTATAGKSFVLMLKQAATTGGGTATFTGVKFGTSGAPTITATAGKMDILTFIADGTNWYGSIAQGYTP